MAVQNCNKVEEVKNKVKENDPESRKVVKNLIENKLFMADQNREKELQKRLEHLRKHVGGFGWVSIDVVLCFFKCFMGH